MSSLGGIIGGLGGGGSIGSAVVKLQLENSQYNEQLAKTEAQTKTSTSSMSKTTAALGKASTLVYGAIAIAAVEFAKSAVEAAIAANEAQLKLTNSIENSKTVTESAIPAFNKAALAISNLTGVHSDAITAMQAFLVQMHLTQIQVETLTPLVVDLSVKQGIDLTTAAKAVGKAVNGTTGGLSRMGVVVDKTAAKTDAYGATLKALGVVQGFAAQSANEEPWKLLGNQVHQLSIDVGEDLLPALKGIIPVLTEIVANAKPAFTLLGNIVQEISSAGIQNPNQGGGTSPLDAMFGVGFTAKAIGGQALLDSYTAKLTILIEAYKMGTLPASDFNAAVGDLLTSVGQSPDVFGTATDFTVLYQSVIDKTKLSLKGMGSATDQAVIATKNFKTHLRTASADILTLGNTIKTTFDLTPAELQKDFDQMLAISIRWKSDEVAALKLKPGSFGISSQDYVAFFDVLNKKGPDAVDAFVRSNHAAQQKMISEWQQWAHTIGSIIPGAFPRSINTPALVTGTGGGHHRLYGP